MSSWLSLVVGVILGLLFGWVIELFYRRRPRSTDEAAVGIAVTPTVVPAEVKAGAVEPVSAPPIPAPLEELVVEAPELDRSGEELDRLLEELDRREALERSATAIEEGEAPAAEVRADQYELPEMILPPFEGAEVKAVDWHEVSERVGEVAEEVELPAAEIHELTTELPDLPSRLPEAVAELPEAGVRLPEAAVEALAPTGASLVDDLTRIEGIGPVYNRRLQAGGIPTFAALAAADPVRLAEIIQPQSWQRLNYVDWIEQARLIMAGDEEALQKLQARLFSKKKS